MKQRTRTIDCLKLKADIQAQLLKEYAHMTDKQRQQAFARKLARSQSPIAGLWRQLNARQYESTACADKLSRVAEKQEDYGSHKDFMAKVKFRRNSP